MNHALRLCFFCRASAMFGPSADLDVCQACALRIADLAADPSDAIWTNAASTDRRPSASPEPVEKIDDDQRFEAFKEGVAKQISEDDADSHFHLAEAYSEMGLYVDARREAAVAITSGLTTKTTTAALRLLLRAPHTSKETLARLRERLLRPVN